MPAVKKRKKVRKKSTPVFAPVIHRSTFIPVPHEEVVAARRKPVSK